MGKDELSTKKLQIKYFLNEFAGYEVESKYESSIKDPLEIFNIFLNDIKSGKWDEYGCAETMGSLNIGHQHIKYPFHFYGKVVNGSYKQVAMVAERNNCFMLAFKNPGDVLKSPYFNVTHPPLIREEKRKGDWISYKKMLARLLQAEPAAEYVGTNLREKHWIYISNKKTFRNFSVSCDLNKTSEDRMFAQVEIEYKGRSGEWFPFDEDIVSAQVLEEYEKFHNILLKYDFIKPSDKKKFDWIME